MWTIKQTTIDEINETLSNGKNVTFQIDKKHNVAGVLAVLRKAFPDNFVQKINNKYDGTWDFKIYAGDKETQKFLNTEIKFDTPQQEMRKWLKQSKNELKKINKDN